MRTVEMRYKCVCMEEEVSVMLAERRVNEDIRDYMAYMQAVICSDHRLRSPLCEQKNMEYVKLFLSKDGGIGYAEGGNA